MLQPNSLIPRLAVPELKVETLDHGSWRLAARTPERFNLVVFYRGLHCPVCARYLADLEKHLGAFEERGTEVIAISSDVAERARQAQVDWGVQRLTIGYGLNLNKAREWGLYISSGIGKSSVGIEEPELFSEPGMFLVRADGTLYFSMVQTMPFARPRMADIVAALDVVIERDYPARGEVIDHNEQRVA